MQSTDPIPLALALLVTTASLSSSYAFSQAFYSGNAREGRLVQPPARSIFGANFLDRFSSGAFSRTPPCDCRGTGGARGSGGLTPLFASWDGGGGGGGGGIERLEFTISPSGLVTEKVTGVTGPSCKIVTEEVRAGKAPKPAQKWPSGETYAHAGREERSDEACKRQCRMNNSFATSD